MRWRFLRCPARERPSAVLPVWLPCWASRLPPRQSTRPRPRPARSNLGIVFLRLLRNVRRHHPVGIAGFGRHILGQLALFQLGLLFGDGRRSDGSIGVRPRWQIGDLKMRRHHFQADLDQQVSRGRRRDRRSADAQPPARHRRGEAQARPVRRISTTAGNAFARCRASPCVNRSRSGTGRSGFRNAFQRHQLDLRLAAGAQDLEHVHQFAIGHARVGAQEDAAILVASAIASSERTRSARLTGVSPMATARSGLMLT